VVAAINVSIPWSGVPLADLVGQLGATLTATARQITSLVA
jgi:DNA-binding IclR family transcriptional regulator